jgi:glycosyltransferase involved in cell wall biosynthesis
MQTLLVFYPRYVLGNGGVTITLRSFVKELKESFDEIVVFHNDGFVREFPNYNEEIPKKNWLIFQFQRFSLIRKCDFVLIISGLRPQNMLNIFLAICIRKPFVIQPHGAFHNDLFLRRNLIKKLFSRVEAFLVSKAKFIHYLNLRERNASRFNRSTTKYLICPIGVPLYNKILWTGGENFFVWYGRFDIHVKGLDLLLTSWAKMSEEDRPKLILAGRDSRSGGGVSKVQEMIDQLKLKNSVELRGPLETLEDKFDFVLHSKGLIFPSRIDADSQVIAENLSWGVPILASEKLRTEDMKSSNYPFIFCDFTDFMDVSSSLLNIETHSKLISIKSFEYSHKFLNRKLNARIFFEALISN